MTLKQLVCFCIRMEQDDGIIGKSPGYVLEKYEQAMGMENPENILDSENTAKFNEYKKKWKISYDVTQGISEVRRNNGGT